MHGQQLESTVLSILYSPFLINTRKSANMCANAGWPSAGWISEARTKLSPLIEPSEDWMGHFRKWGAG
jgi:hypothetical protein